MPPAPWSKRLARSAAGGCYRAKGESDEGGTVATYAYVNPVVAIALGAIVLHESLTWTIGIGAALVLACVAIVVRRESEVASAVRFLLSGDRIPEPLAVEAGVPDVGEGPRAATQATN